MRVQSLSDMQPRSPFDRTLLIPIAIGVISILGIGWIFLTSDLREIFMPSTPVPTAVPFDVHSLDTQVAVFYPTEEEPLPTATRTPPVAYPGPSTKTLLVTSTKRPPTPHGATPTPDGIKPLSAGKKYDDTDPNIAYDWRWTALKNPSTVNEYKGTIHASNSIGSEASFRFTGERFNLGYKRGRSFGTVTVLIDEQPYSFNEQAFDLVWRSPELAPGDHFVRIIHDSGESINLDYIEILN